MLWSESTQRYSVAAIWPTNTNLLLLHQFRSPNIILTLLLSWFGGMCWGYPKMDEKSDNFTLLSVRHMNRNKTSEGEFSNSFFIFPDAHYSSANIVITARLYILWKILLTNEKNSNLSSGLIYLFLLSFCQNVLIACAGWAHAPVTDSQAHATHVIHVVVVTSPEHHLELDNPSVEKAWNPRVYWKQICYCTFAIYSPITHHTAPYQRNHTV